MPIDAEGGRPAPTREEELLDLAKDIDFAIDLTIPRDEMLQRFVKILDEAFPADALPLAVPTRKNRTIEEQWFDRQLERRGLAESVELTALRLRCQQLEQENDALKGQLDLATFLLPLPPLDPQETPTVSEMVPCATNGCPNLALWSNLVANYCTECATKL